MNPAAAPFCAPAVGKSSVVSAELNMLPASGWEKIYSRLEARVEYESAGELCGKCA